MGIRCAVCLLVVILCGLPVLAAEGNIPGGIQVAKYNDENLFLQKKREVSPQVKIKEKFDFYDIDGATTADLRGQMRKNGTKWNDGKIYAALTTWDIRYDYDITSSDGRYYLKGITTDIDIVYHLPRLVPSVKTPEQLTALWKPYIEKLTEHEVGHRDIAVTAAQEVYLTLASIGGSSSKSELDSEAKRLVKARLQRLREIQVDYDAETRHGETQGAVLM